MHLIDKNIQVRRQKSQEKMFNEISILVIYIKNVQQYDIFHFLNCIIICLLQLN